MPRFDAAADKLLRTTDLLSYNSAYTVAFWMYISVDTNAYGTLLALSDNTANNFDILDLFTNGTQLNLQTAKSGIADEIQGTNLTTATWYHVALVRVSTSSCLVYLNGVQDIASTNNIASRTANTRVEFGSLFSGNSEPFNGRIAAIKAWSAALTATELLMERLTILPFRQTNLYGWWPCLPGTTERLRDYGVSGRNWTEGGTLTDEAGPPVTWGIWTPPQDFTSAAVVSDAIPRAAFVLVPSFPAYLEV